MPRLTFEEARRRLERLQGWTLEKTQIRREYAFPKFTDSLAFVNRVGEIAETMDHHPDIDIRYNKVTLTLSTHSEGGVTDKDFELADRIDRAA